MGVGIILVKVQAEMVGLEVVQQMTIPLELVYLEKDMLEEKG